MVLTSSNEVFASIEHVQNNKPATGGIYRLDKTSGALAPLDGSLLSPTNPIRLYGSNGNDLVVSSEPPLFMWASHMIE